MPNIIEIHAREILDSRGNPTLEVEVVTASKAYGSAMVPSGASKGIHEALELRDGDKTRYQGLGVQKAVENVNSIINVALKDLPVINQKNIDEMLINLDGEENKSKLGANAILGVSLAVARAAADFYKMPLFRYLGGSTATLLPRPMINIINGGVHADSGLDFQEYMIVPLNSVSFAKALELSQKVFNELKKLLKSLGKSTSVGDEGGFAPTFKSNEEPLDLILQAIDNAGLKAGKDIAIALDVAASEFYDDQLKRYNVCNRKLTSKEMVVMYEELVKKYPIISIEDGMAQEDYLGWKELTNSLGKKIQLVGDDLFVTNKKILQKGINMGLANAVLIKVNQIGTLSETIDTIKLALENNYKCIISHRSGETEDSFIADLAVAYNIGQIKTGSLSRSERIAKYNRLLKIEELLKQNAKI